ncbi:hypothetical protein BU17DRAFT_51612 [Hysterangium stoloniferum]|nr:hypothetical protein BU17DRAFT_51612 [Hysterangium stoloniferum]
MGSEPLNSLPIHFQDPHAFGGLVSGPQLDPNSPEVFKNNIDIAQQHILRIQQTVQNAIGAIERAYNPNCNYAIQASEIISLKHALDAFADFLRESGVGSLPVMPFDPENLPTQQQMIEGMTKSVQTLYEKRQRLQDNAGAVASLLAIPESRGKRSA